MSNNQENEFDELEYWREDVTKIREDSTHSSIYLSNESLNIIEKFIKKQRYRNRTELIQSLSKLINALVRSKPLMALIYNRSHRILDFIENIPKDERNISKIKNMVLDEIKAIREEFIKKNNTITKLGARIILDQHVILTHSSSSIIESIFMQAKKLKKRFRLICTESRPLMEGTQLALRMAKAGIKTKIIPDADIRRGLDEANFAFLGVDRLTETTFINKTGSGAIATIAKDLNKPLYIAADTEKILLKRTYPARFLSGKEEEIVHKTPQNITIQNIYFEETPLTYIHKIICETGIFETEDFIERYL